VGLDWLPANKPLPGHEDEHASLFKKLASGSSWFRKKRQRRFDEISVAAFETLCAPRVGIDTAATEWARARHAEANVEEPIEQFLAAMHGFYVVPLVPPCDGIPRYSNGSPGGYVEPYSFRAQFLRDCDEIVGNPLVEAAYETKLPAELAAYADALQQAASRFAAARGLRAENPEAEDPDSLEFRLDVVSSAARWCRFWADRKHGLEAWF